MGNWLWRRVLIDILLVGGGNEGVSAEGIEEVVLVKLRDWLNWRIRDELRAGRCSVPVPGVNMSEPIVMWVAGWVAEAVGLLSSPAPPPPGAGKSLRMGSYAEMLAWKSSKLTDGKKS